MQQLPSAQRLLHGPLVEHACATFLFINAWLCLQANSQDLSEGHVQESGCWSPILREVPGAGCWSPILKECAEPAEPEFKHGVRVGSSRDEGGLSPAGPCVCEWLRGEVPVWATAAAGAPLCSPCTVGAVCKQASCSMLPQPRQHATLAANRDSAMAVAGDGTHGRGDSPWLPTTTRGCDMCPARHVPSTGEAQRSPAQAPPSVRSREGPEGEVPAGDKSPTGATESQDKAGAPSPGSLGGACACCGLPFSSSPGAASLGPGGLPDVEPGAQVVWVDGRWFCAQLQGKGAGAQSPQVHWRLFRGAGAEGAGGPSELHSSPGACSIAPRCVSPLCWNA